MFGKICGNVANIINTLAPENTLSIEDAHEILCAPKLRNYFAINLAYFSFLAPTYELRCCFTFLFVTIRHPSQAPNRSLVDQPIWCRKLDGQPMICWFLETDDKQ